MFIALALKARADILDRQAIDEATVFARCSPRRSDIESFKAQAFGPLHLLLSRLHDEIS